ncbi:hypothetical protein [Xanthobacter sediminis]
MPTPEDLERGARTVASMLSALETRVSLRRSEMDLIRNEANEIMGWLKQAAENMRGRRATEEGRAAE